MQRPTFLRRTTNDEALGTNIVSKAHVPIYWLTFYSIVLVLIVPIWTIHYLPLVDYPHALGRGYIAAHYDAVPLFQRMYEPPLSIVPNMAFEALCSWAGRVVPVDLLGRIFISAIIFLFALGCHSVARLFAGGNSWTALPMIFFIYSTHLKYGNINFLFALAVFLLLYALWRRSVVAHPWSAALLLTLILPVTFLSHLATYAFEWVAVGLSLVFLAKQRQLTLPHIIGQLVALLLPLVLFQLFLSHGGTVGRLSFNSPLMKLVETLTLISTYRRWFDVIFLASLLVITIYSLRKIERFHISKEAATIGLTFYALLLATPSTFFTSNGADVRFLIPSFVFSIASIRFSISSRDLRTTLALLLIVSLVRIGVIVFDWNAMNQWLEPQMALLEKVPSESRFYPLSLPDSSRSLEGKLFPAFGIYPIVANGSYHPALLTIRSQHPVVGRDGGHYLPPEFQDKPELSNERLRQILDSNDYLWCYRLSPQILHSLEPFTEVASTGRNALLLRVRHDRK